MTLKNKKILIINSPPRLYDSIDRLINKYSDGDIHLFIPAKYKEYFREYSQVDLKITTFAELDFYSISGNSFQAKKLSEYIHKRNFDQITILNSSEKSDYHCLWWYLNIPVKFYTRRHNNYQLGKKAFLKYLYSQITAGFKNKLLSKLLVLCLLPVNFLAFLIYSAFDFLWKNENSARLSMDFSSFLAFIQDELTSTQNNDRGKLSRNYKYYSTALLKKPPYFIIAGVEKSGSSTFSKHLSRHPQLNAPRPKTNFYFMGNNNHQFGKSWYLSLFPSKLSLKHKARKTGKRQLSFEWGIPYFSKQQAPALIKHTLEDVHLIFILRNPVKRAYSHYQYATKKTYNLKNTNWNIDSEITFEKALESELEALGNITPESTVENLHVRHPKMFRYGLYYIYLKNWLDYFSLDQMLFIKSKNLFLNPTGTLNRVTSFLEIEPYEGDKNLHINKGEYPPMQEEMKKYLKELYQPYNNKLYNLLDRNLNWEQELQ